MSSVIYIWVNVAGSGMPPVNELRATGLRKLATATFRKPYWSGNALRFLTAEGWGFDVVRTPWERFYVDLIKVENGFVVLRSPLTQAEWTELLNTPPFRLCLTYPLLRRCRGRDEYYPVNTQTYKYSYDTSAAPYSSLNDGTDGACGGVFDGTAWEC